MCLVHNDQFHITPTINNHNRDNTGPTTTSYMYRGW